MKQRNIFLLVALLMIVTLGILIVGTAPKQIDGPDTSVPAEVETSREIIKQFRGDGSHPDTAEIPNPVIPLNGISRDSETPRPTDETQKANRNWFGTNIVHSSPQPNTITFGAREVTIITKNEVNTSTVLNYLVQRTEQNNYIEARLAELGAIAAGFQKGMKQPEVEALLGEEPTRLATNQSGIWVLYSAHPQRQEPQPGNKFMVFRLRFDPSGSLEKWWFDTRH